MHNAVALVPMLVLLLAACGGPDGDARTAATAAPADPALPAPGGDGDGSVTGMPTPGSDEAVVTLGPGGPAEAREDLADAGGGASMAGIAGDPAAPGGTGPDGAPLAPDTTGMEGAAATAAGARVDDTMPPSGTGASDAMATVRSYYSAISAGDYARAHGLWSGNGSASGQSLEQFASGFADTADVRVHMMEPRAAGGGAAGSQYITVPVTLDTTGRDGSSVQFTGSYTLRRPADGSGDWRIDSADLREVRR